MRSTAPTSSETIISWWRADHPSQTIIFRDCRSETGREGEGDGVKRVWGRGGEGRGRGRRRGRKAGRKLVQENWMDSPSVFSPFLSVCVVCMLYVCVYHFCPCVCVGTKRIAQRKNDQRHGNRQKSRDRQVATFCLCFSLFCLSPLFSRAYGVTLFRFQARYRYVWSKFRVAWWFGSPSASSFSSTFGIGRRETISGKDDTEHTHKHILRT